jgi:hypothetical protein
MGKFDKINSIMQNEEPSKEGGGKKTSSESNDVIEGNPTITLKKEEFREVVRAKVEASKLQPKKKVKKPELQSIKVENTHYKSLFLKFYEKGISMVELNSYFYKKLDEDKDYFKEIVGLVVKAKLEKNGEVNNSGL